MIYKTLYLNLTRGWFDLIRCGMKHSEFRQAKDYYIKRLTTPDGKIKPFSIVHMRNGYNAKDRVMEFWIIGIRRINHICWGDVFEIQLGDRII